jgi:hypothetical protein
MALAMIGRMRGAAILLGVAACSDAGAHLTLRAPDGPVNATTFEVVLASPALVPVIPNQRVSPKTTTQETVTYFLQRTAAGATGGAVGTVDGFTILVEPDAEVADQTFIPFVLLYDDASQLVGVATYEPDPTVVQPSPIFVQHGQVAKYDLAVEPVTEVADTGPVATRDAMPVKCTRDDQSTFLSGVVWRPRGSGELRLLLPDDPSSTDATQRMLDLDCDGHAVTETDTTADCDDTRARFHAGAKEQCDGEDWNCDAVPYVVLPCTGSPLCSSSNTGYQLCDDTSGTLGACSADVACICASNPTSTSCVRCVLQFAHGNTLGEVAPCQPGVGTLSTQGVCENTTCTVDVVSVRGGWDVGVGQTSAGPFLPTVANITGQFAIRAKRPEGSGASLPGTAGGSMGVAELVIVPANGTPAKWLSVDLELATQQQTSCSGNGPFVMSCSP